MLYQVLPPGGGVYSPVEGAIWSESDGWLVPVEPCVHGNYARHIVGYGERMNTFAMCDGVGEGDSDE